ncbi:hypothetical protein HDU67_006412 [Dinochytrium kinnereticum]|nr:hypothetical protein HDU67_006412 [Dinochytrium kinnereticum]
MSKAIFPESEKVQAPQANDEKNSNAALPEAGQVFRSSKMEEVERRITRVRTERKAEFESKKSTNMKADVEDFDPKSDRYVPIYQPIDKECNFNPGEEPAKPESVRASLKLNPIPHYDKYLSEGHDSRSVRDTEGDLGTRNSFTTSIKSFKKKQEENHLTSREGLLQANAVLASGETNEPIDLDVIITTPSPLALSSPFTGSDEVHYDEPFIPMTAECKFAFQSVSSLYADWNSRLSAVLITIIFTSTEPQLRWTSCRGSLPYDVVGYRSLVTIVLGLSFDALAIYLDHHIAKIDFMKGLMEFRDIGISFMAFLHISLIASSVSGLLILSQPGVIQGSDCFRVGRMS